MSDSRTDDGAVTAAELDERLKPQYPTYLDDPDGLALFRDEVLRNRGHDMASVNHNSLGRLLDTIAALRRERDAAREGCAIWHERYRNSVDERDALRRERDALLAVQMTKADLRTVVELTRACAKKDAALSGFLAIVNRTDFLAAIAGNVPNASIHALGDAITDTLAALTSASQEAPASPAAICEACDGCGLEQHGESRCRWCGGSGKEPAPASPAQENNDE